MIDQADVTVIAGLLIFLTVEPVSKDVMPVVSEKIEHLNIKQQKSAKTQ
jgi:hypothetical protein